MHRGWPKDEILDSYHGDCRNVADTYSNQSVKNGQQIFALLKILGTARIRDVSLARMNLFAAIHDSEQGKRIDEGIECQREHFDNVGFFCC